jgi:hypothetical protein
LRDWVDCYKKNTPKDHATAQAAALQIEQASKKISMALSQGSNLSVRAALIGQLLCSVLTLLTAQRLDAVGCMILARNHPHDENPMPSLRSEVA